MAAQRCFLNPSLIAISQLWQLLSAFLSSSRCIRRFIIVAQNVFLRHMTLHPPINFEDGERILKAFHTAAMADGTTPNE